MKGFERFACMVTQYLVSVAMRVYKIVSIFSLVACPDLYYQVCHAPQG